MWLWDWLWMDERRRPTTWKELAVALVLLAALVGLLIPFLDCPCGSRPPTTESEFFAWAENRCGTCDGQGKVHLLNRLWQGKPRVDAEDSAPPDENP